MSEMVKRHGTTVPWAHATHCRCPGCASKETRVRPRALLIDRLGFERITEWPGGHTMIVAAYGGLGRPYREVLFENHGYVERDGERLIEFHEADERPVPQWYLEPPSSLPDVAALARAIFDTDPEVCAFISGVADNCVRLTETRWNNELGRSETVAVPGVVVAEIRQWDPRLLQTAWNRDEQGWRRRAERRAKGIVDALKKAGVR